MNCVLHEFNISEVTLDKKIQTPKCSKDSPLFNLTVANRSKKPSRALWSETQPVRRPQTFLCPIKPFTELEQESLYINTLNMPLFKTF